MSKQKRQVISGQSHPIEGHPRKCPQCGKKFYPTSQWAYRNKTKTWCSWKCLREDEAGIPPHVQPEPEPERPLTDEQMARLAEAEAHEKQISDAIPVVPAKEKRDEAERKRGTKGGHFFRSERTERMARAAYETIQEGGSIADLAEEYGVNTAVLYAQAKHWRQVHNLPGLSTADRQSRAGKARAEQMGFVNHSGEKTARIADRLRRLHRLLDEIRKEAGISA